MIYNRLYQNNKNVWGDSVNKLIILVFKNLKPGSTFLDLGCGQGKDALFMARNNFQVTAVDASEAAISQLKSTAQAEGLKNLKAIRSDVKDFKIENNKYEIIFGNNLLQFLDKDSALPIVNDIKEKVSPDGYIILASFTTDDPSYSKQKENKAYFKPQELLKLFAGFKIIHYFENKVMDNGHPGSPESHQHGVVRIIAQKQ